MLHFGANFGPFGKVYKPNIFIPESTKNLITPIFMDLQKDELLLKCMHGQTQNKNEALNSLICSRVPKITFVSKNVMEMDVNSNVLHFNDGRTGVLKVL